MGTRWSAGQAADSWLQVDLGATHTLSEVQLAWEDSYTKGYKLQGSTDGRTWRDLFTRVDGKGGTETIPVSGSARYVRMQGTEKSGQWGYSLYELRVYG
ncbi:discoidin domain-containing protein [Streptomyces sp. SPB074]|uniref:discoidin domain-containing protein n=1 Tax=Streptomyces sp. (strain SPB074) TaxID=465543 RepID=UPI001F47C0F6|nr:discoidin domain-containing protein [Streptomyces sp. SPB074]